jgi:hypothetical protein
MGGLRLPPPRAAPQRPATCSHRRVTFGLLGAFWLLAISLRRATVNYRDGHKLAPLTFTAGPGYRWATPCGYSVILFPRSHSSVKGDSEMIAFAAALVVVGAPAPWNRLLRYAGDAGIPCATPPASDARRRKGASRGSPLVSGGAARNLLVCGGVGAGITNRVIRTECPVLSPRFAAVLVELGVSPNPRTPRRRRSTSAFGTCSLSVGNSSGSGRNEEVYQKVRTCRSPRR